MCYYMLDVCCCLAVLHYCCLAVLRRECEERLGVDEDAADVDRAGQHLGVVLNTCIHLCIYIYICIYTHIHT